MRTFGIILVVIALIVLVVCYEFPKPVYGLWNYAYANVWNFLYPQKIAWQPPSESTKYPTTWTLSNGITYKNVKVMTVEADQVTITHSNGTSVLKMAALPGDLQSLLNYDPAAATYAANQRTVSNFSAVAVVGGSDPTSDADSSEASQVDYQKIASIKAQMFTLLQQADQADQAHAGSDKAEKCREKAEALQVELEVLEK